MIFTRRSWLILAATMLAVPAYSQDRVREADAQMYPTDVSYDSSVPRPADIIGHELGAAPVRHHKMVEYLTLVAEQSDRMSIETIGYTHERRPIVFLTITSPQNRANLEDIRRQHIALTEPQLEQDVSDDMPVVTWLNYGVHGAESSGMDAVLPFVYYMAAAQDDTVDAMLAQSVILVTAVFNPDGHSKRIAWFDAYGAETNNPDPQHVEHNFNWQFARTNHYFFDLNRQWLLVTQPEPRAWMTKWHQWRPNLTVDYHEMGSDQTYYFHPGVDSRTNPLVPDEAERLMAETVKTSEAFLDEQGRLYYHGEDFDNYYIGKGSTFPLVNGGVGVLYEAAAALGREIETGNGLRTYRENILKHFRTSIASVRGGVNHRLDYLRYQKWFYDSALEEASDAAVQAYVFSANDDPARMHHFVDLLNYHRISARMLTRDITVNGESYAAGDALIVPVAQPQYRLIRSLFETAGEFEDATFYDVSAWTMPLAFGLKYSALSGRTFRDDYVGETTAPEIPVKTAPEPSTFGYIIDWSSYYAPKALNRVLEAGLLARVAMEPFSVTTKRGTRQFYRGDIVVPLDRQETDPADIHALMSSIATDDGIAVFSMSSGRSALGTAGVEVGGPSFKSLALPKVLIVVGADVNLYDAGEAWHLMDWRMGMTVSLRPRDLLEDIDWSRYTHVVFPGGETYDEYVPEYLDRLRLWAAEGGTVIGLRQAAAWVRMNILDYVDPELAEAELLADEPVGSGHDELLDEAVVARYAYSEKAEREAVDVIGGAIFAGDLDNSHPLGFGYDNRKIALHKNIKDVMEPTANPYATVIEYRTPALLSGYASEENQLLLAGTPALIAERYGMGSVILFADNPNFRGYWYGTNKLFLNALFFSTVFDPPVEE